MTLSPFLHRAQTILCAPPTHELAFETPRGDRAAVSTDFALKLVLGSGDSGGHLVLASPNELPTVDACMQTVLTAVVDTAARGEAMAVFLALSGAWEHASRERSDDPLPLPAPPRRPPPSPPRECARADLPDSPRALADACTRFEEWRHEACFCTHAGVTCSVCESSPIRGARYRCKTVNLCERCRRKLGDVDMSWTVYEHPWEACDGYDEGVKAPPPPLKTGDGGAAVLHLQYVLCRTGFLSLGAFRPGVYCRGTMDGVRWVQREHRVGEDGVYNGCTRGCLLGKVEEMERQCGGRCATVGGAQEARLRTALAA